MQADITSLFRSPVIRLLDFHCKETPDSVSALEISSAYEISFTRTGFFGIQEGKRYYDVDICGLLFYNKGSERIVCHGSEVRDTCTLLQVPEHLLQEAATTHWKKRSSFPAPLDTFAFPSTVAPSNPAIDFLHLRLYRSAQEIRAAGMTLKVEELGLELLNQLFLHLYDPKTQEKFDFNGKERKQHLEMIERAKHYIAAEFDQELSLHHIARRAHASIFHFSRIFKQFTSHSPYQYLMEVRLNHAARLLRNTSLSVTEVCFDSGFSSFPHFITTFNRYYGLSPSKYRTSSAF